MDEPIFPDTKVCFRCKIERPAELFGITGKYRNKLKSYCNPCLNEMFKLRRSANLEQHRAAERERARKRYAKDPERARAAARTRYSDSAEAAEKAIERAKAWQRENPDLYREGARRWRKANPEKVQAKAARRAARRRGATAGTVDADALWTAECGICKGPLDRLLAYPDPLSKSLDHIIPLVHGGSHEQSNLQWTHLLCNKRKGASLTD